MVLLFKWVRFVLYYKLPVFDWDCIMLPFKVDTVCFILQATRLRLRLYYIVAVRVGWVSWFERKATVIAWDYNKYYDVADSLGTFVLGPGNLSSSFDTVRERCRLVWHCSFYTVWGSKLVLDKLLPSLETILTLCCCLGALSWFYTRCISVFYNETQSFCGTINVQLIRRPNYSIKLTLAGYIFDAAISLLWLILWMNAVRNSGKLRRRRKNDVGLSLDCSV